MSEVHVTAPGADYVGTLIGEPTEAPHPLTGRIGTRVLVQRKDTGVKEYVWTSEPGVMIQEVGVAETLGHLAPAPGSAPEPPPGVQVVGSAPTLTPDPDPTAAATGPARGTPPPRGVTVGGVPLGEHPDPILYPSEPGDRPLPSLPTGGIAALGEAAFGQPEPEETRYMVQVKKGKPSTYHTRPDCPRAKNAERTRKVDDEDIEFFDLSHCQVCSTRESQISWQEALSEALGVVAARAAEESLVRWGFRVSPDLVDRKRPEDPSTEG